MEGNCVEGRGQRSGPGESMGSLWLAGSLSRGEGRSLSGLVLGAQVQGGRESGSLEAGLAQPQPE